MKKSLLALCLLALGSLHLHAAAFCTGTVITIGGCVIDNGPNSWTLSNFAFTGASPSGAAAGVNPNGIVFNVTPYAFPTPFGFGQGFKVVTSRTPGTGLFTVSESALPSVNSLFLETSFQISSGNVGTGLLVNMGLSIDPPAGAISSFYNAGIGGPGLGAPTRADVTKFVQRLNSISNNVAQIQQEMFASYQDIPNSLTNFYPPDSYFNNLLIAPNAGALVVVDRLAMRAFREAGFASAASYTNYFAPAAPQNAIPEPMTFALMGAGLIGLAVLRRRK